MKRPVILVEVTEGEQTLHTESRSAFNAGVRASEAAVREVARAAGEFFVGGSPSRWGERYTRTWRGERSGRVVIAVVTAVYS